jgi:hypothetical protein
VGLFYIKYTIATLVMDPIINSTNNVHQRNLAEIEFDWLAAVVERIFLFLFMVLFFLMSFGINAIGAYYCNLNIKGYILNFKF